MFIEIIIKWEMEKKGMRILYNIVNIIMTIVMEIIGIIDALRISNIIYLDDCFVH